MKTTLAIAACLVALGACSPSAEAPAAAAPGMAALEGEELRARGEYLVTGLLGCNDCHTPMTPAGPDMTKSLWGADLIFKPINDMPWAPVAPRLAGLPDGYTADQLATFLQTGQKASGGTALPPMPQFRLNAEDARAAVAYIASVPRAPEQ
jgi:cytochrome c553